MVLAAMVMDFWTNCLFVGNYAQTGPIMCDFNHFWDANDYYTSTSHFSVLAIQGFRTQKSTRTVTVRNNEIKKANITHEQHKPQLTSYMMFSFAGKEELKLNNTFSLFRSLLSFSHRSKKTFSNSTFNLF